MKALRVARVALAILLLPVAAQAGRPFVTEDAVVLDPGGCEWENVAARATVPGVPRASALSTQLGCGVGRDLQFALNASRAKAAGERASGLGVGGKWGIASAGESAVTLAWGSSWSKLRGASTEWDGASVNLALSQGLGGGWTAHANLGRSYSRPDRESVTTWAGLVERQLSESVDVGAEVFGEGSQRPGFGLGARWRPADGWTLDASVARSGSNPRERLVTLGLKLEF